MGTHLVLGWTEKSVFAPVIPLNYVSFQGVWTNNGNYALSRSGAAIRLHFQARDVYLVLGGRGKVTEMLGRSSGTRGLPCPAIPGSTRS